MEEKLDKIIYLLEQIAEIDNIPSKSSGSKWSQAEIDKLLEMFRAGYSTAKIAIALTKEFNSLRSVYAVNLQIIEQIEILRDKKVREQKRPPIKEPEDTRPIMDLLYEDGPPF